MSFTYDAGTTTPNRAGLVEAGGIRLNDGTFELFAAHGLLLDSPDVRPAVTTYPYWHGGFAGSPFYDPLDILLEGEIKVPDVDDLWDAIDLLKAAFNLADPSLQVVKFKAPSWTDYRRVSARVAGPISIESPANDLDAHWRKRRGFSVPLIAPNPRIRSDTQHSVNITTSTDVTNVGSMSTGFIVRFNGPRTNPQIDLDGSSGTDRIRVAAVITSGHWIEINTYDPDVGTLTAVDDTGANVYADVTAATARELPPGTSTWTASSDAGSGTVTLKFRDAWA